MIATIESELHCCGFNTTSVDRKTTACKTYTKTCAEVVSSHFVVVGGVMLGLIIVEAASIWAAAGVWRNRDDESDKPRDKHEGRSLLGGREFRSL